MITASFAGDSTYTAASGTGTLTVQQANPTVTAAAAGEAYNADAYVATGSAMGVIGENLSPVSITYYAGPQATGQPLAGPPVDAGTYTVVASYAGSANYTANSDTKTFTIAPAHLTVTAIPNSKIYGQIATETGSFVGTQGTDAITASFSSSGDIATADAGSYAIMATLAGANLNTDYIVDSDLNHVGTLTVGTATLMVSAGLLNKQYGQNLTLPPGTVAGIQNGDPITAMLLSDAAAAAAPVKDGGYPISAVLSDNGTGKLAKDYTTGDLSNVGTLTVGPAPLTVTVNSATRAYGQPNPPFSSSYSGFRNGDQAGSLTGTLAYSTDATVYSAAGTYAVTAAGLTSTNYMISYVPGILVVTPVISITGAVFNDANNDGLLESGETGLAGVTVFLDANGNGILDPGEISTTTDANGNYAFSDIVPGTYVVRQTPFAGYATTAPLGYSQTVNVLAGQTAAGPVFGDVLVSSVPLDFNYLVALARNYGQPGTFATGDLNGDGKVDFNDFVLLARNYGHALSTWPLQAAAAAPASPAVFPGASASGQSADAPQFAGRKRHAWRDRSGRGLPWGRVL